MDDFGHGNKKICYCVLRNLSEGGLFRFIYGHQKIQVADCFLPSSQRTGARDSYRSFYFLKPPFYFLRQRQSRAKQKSGMRTPIKFNAFYNFCL